MTLQTTSDTIFGSGYEYQLKYVNMYTLALRPYVELTVPFESGFPVRHVAD